MSANDFGILVLFVSFTVIVLSVFRLLRDRSSAPGSLRDHEERLRSVFGSHIG